jgi:hypothetical protein
MTFTNKINQLTFFYDYDEYIAFLNSLKKRGPNELTGTPCDFFTDEEIKELNAKGITNLNPLIPIPNEIKELTKFSLTTHAKLLKKFPNDEWLIFLGSEEGMKYICNTNWFEDYGVFKKV